jgi:hypothetical protein
MNEAEMLSGLVAHPAVMSSVVIERIEQIDFIG